MSKRVKVKTTRIERMSNAERDMKTERFTEKYGAQELSAALWNYLTDKKNMASKKALVEVAHKYEIENTIRNLYPDAFK